MGSSKSGNRTNHGSPRPGTGRPAANPDRVRRATTQDQVYLRGLAITRPATAEGKAVIDWWRGLSPDERLAFLVEHHRA